MKNFPIFKFSPQLIHPRIYLYQLLEESFGLSEGIREELINTFGGDSPEIIDTLTLEDLTLVLTWEYFPESIFVFKEEFNNLPAIITDISPNNSLCCLLDKCSLNEVDLPVLYTGINQVSFENNGLLVMEKYKSQIYNCCLPSGKDLLGNCHDCELGYNGLIYYRGSGDSDICYELTRWSGTELEEFGTFWPTERPDVFPSLGSRDLIPEMLTERENIIDYYPELEYESVEDIYQLLSNFSGAFRVLVHEYSNNQELALAAVQSNILAFTFLSEDLRQNISFINRLFSNLSESYKLYNYLDENIRNNRNIILQVYRQYPSAIEKLNIIEDKEIIINLFKDNYYDAGKYISLLSNPLKTDNELLIQLAKLNWRMLLEHSPELYSNLKFIEKLIFEILLVEQTVYKYILSLPDGIKLIEENKDILNKLPIEFIVSNIRSNQLIEVLTLLNLTPLTAATAELLAKNKSNLNLRGLTSISPIAAESLSKHKGDSLDLGGLTSLSDSAADSLSKHEGDSLGLGGLSSLSDSAAELLVKYKGDSLDLGGLTSLSDVAAASLSKYKGYLNLHGLRSISDTAIESLLKRSSSTFLSDRIIQSFSKSLTSLTDAVAASLSKYKGVIILNGLTSISDSAAASLSKHEGGLHLDGLISLSDSAAESLSKYKGVLILNGLLSLTDSVAASLSNHEGGLHLDGLISLSDSAAESFSRHDGHLCLNGLTSLSDAAAKSLSNHKGTLDLTRLTSISDSAAASLSQHEGGLHLDGLISLCDAAAESLSNHKGDLNLRGLTSLSDAAAASLSNHKGYLDLTGLTSISDAAAEFLNQQYKSSESSDLPF